MKKAAKKTGGAKASKVAKNRNSADPILDNLQNLLASLKKAKPQIEASRRSVDALVKKLAATKSKGKRLK